MFSYIKENGQVEEAAVLGHSNYLAAKNAHSRDAFIRFYEVGHRYEITIIPEDTTKYTSATTWNHAHFPKFDSDAIISKMMNNKSKWNKDNKYWGMSATEIKQSWNKNGEISSSAGTAMHFQIECFMNIQIHDNYDDIQTTHSDLMAYYSLEKESKPEKTINNNNNSDEWSFFIQFIADHPTMIPYRTEWTVFDETVHIAGSIDMVYKNIQEFINE